MAEFRHETERLVLRDWRAEDREPFAAMNADPEVMRYFRSTLSREQSDAFADRIEGQLVELGYGLFALERRDDGAFLGYTGFFPCPEATPVAGEMEIGWRIARPHWRLGYAFEAASSALRWFWQNTDRTRVVSYTSPRNAPSLALMRKLGLHRCEGLDFDHPAIPSGDPLARQVVYGLRRSGATNG